MITHTKKIVKAIPSKHYSVNTKLRQSSRQIIFSANHLSELCIREMYKMCHQRLISAHSHFNIITYRFSVFLIFKNMSGCWILSGHPASNRNLLPLSNFSLKWIKYPTFTRWPDKKTKQTIHLYLLNLINHIFSRVILKINKRWDWV